MVKLSVKNILDENILMFEIQTTMKVKKVLFTKGDTKRAPISPTVEMVNQLLIHETQKMPKKQLLIES